MILYKGSHPRNCQHFRYSGTKSNLQVLNIADDWVWPHFKVAPGSIVLDSKCPVLDLV